MRELKEKLNFQQWTHLLLYTLQRVHEEDMCEFYSKPKLLEDDTVSTNIEGVEMVFDVKRLG